jgi:CRISPR/Cas system-associated exonuclease Cas4 (RecB family)
MADLNKMWVSQASLSAWLNCALKFKFRYIDGLFWPMPMEGPLSDHMELGRKFHLLAQHYYMNGQTQLAQDQDPVLGQWIEALMGFLPRSEYYRFLPEYELRASRDGLRLLAKYDLLVAGEKGVTIYDWKTNDKPPRQALKSLAQTRIYLYLLGLTDYFVIPTENLRMVYWNPRFPQEPLTISYSSEQREQDGQWLAKLVAEIQGTGAYPATSNEKNCRFCEYRPVCHGQGLEETDQDSLDLEEIDWDQIQEIALQGVNLP